MRSQINCITCWSGTYIETFASLFCCRLWPFMRLAPLRATEALLTPSVQVLRKTCMVAHGVKQARLLCADLFMASAFEHHCSSLGQPLGAIGQVFLSLEVRLLLRKCW